MRSLMNASNLDVPTKFIYNGVSRTAEVNIIVVLKCARIELDRLIKVPISALALCQRVTIISCYSYLLSDVVFLAFCWRKYPGHVHSCGGESDQ